MHILVVRIDGIGDLICTTPLLKMLRARYPEAHIDFLANLGPHEVLKHSPLIDRLDIDYRTKVSGSRLKGLLKFPTRLLQWFNRRFRGYDLVIIAHYGLQSRAMRIALGCKTSIILAHIEDEHHVQYTDPRLQLIPFKPNLHEVEGVCAVLEPLGIQERPSTMSLAIAPDAETNLTRLMHQVFGHSVKNVIGLNISASSQPRTWPSDCFLDLIKVLTQTQLDLRFLINGQPDDLVRFSQLLQERGLDTKSLIHLQKTPSLQALFACINACSVYVGSEGGSVHMAAALGIPQVALYQNMPIKLTRWYPWGAPYKLLTPPIGDATVSGVQPTQVATAIEALLAERI